MSSFITKVISILVTTVFISAAVADAEQEKAKEFAKEIQKAFDTGNKLDTDILKTGIESWSGECVTSYKGRDGLFDTHTYIDGELTIESFRKMGKRNIKFGYGHGNYEQGFAEYPFAYVNAEGDLTIDAVTEWNSGEGTVHPFRSFETMTLRRGTFNGENAYLFQNKGVRFTSVDSKTPISDEKLICYFDERK